MTASHEEELIEDIAGFTRDPLRYVLYAFPWGEPGELRQHTGPRRWQRDVLDDMGTRLRAGGTVDEAIQVAVSSGHGIGKSALVSWCILWAMSTYEDTKVVATAETERQLRTKTWPEVAKWHRMAINAHWFKFTATSLYSADPQHEKTWRADAIPWSPTRTEAFAGLHNEGRRLMVVFDEASAIDDRIWEVSEGALTDANTQILWLAFGNPTRNTGRFRECFGRFKHRWTTRQIDSRTVEGTNKAQFAKLVEDYGEDSDFVRVRVKGEFPRAGSAQLIDSDLVAEGSRREATSNLSDPLILGVDVARFGDDQSVMQFRRGLDARTFRTMKFRGLDTMALAGRVASAIQEYQPHAVFVDETGLGAGVVDRLRQLGHRVQGVNFGSGADGPVGDELVANKRAEMWVRMRAWLRSGGAIADDPELRGELEAVEFGYNARNEIQLEKKDDMKKRGLASPDCADALAITFAYPVAPVYGDRIGRARTRVITEYDPFAAMETVGGGAAS